MHDTFFANYICLMINFFFFLFSENTQTFDCILRLNLIFITKNTEILQLDWTEIYITRAVSAEATDTNFLSWKTNHSTELLPIVEFL